MNKQKTMIPWLSALALGLGACAGEGRLVLKVTDAPPDTDAMNAVLVTLSGVEAHVVARHDKDDSADKADKDLGKPDKETGWRFLVAPPHTFDLLRLQNGVIETLGELGLPEGKITQIRLHIDQAGPNEVHLTDGRVCLLDLRNVDKTGIKINHPFKALDVAPGRTTEVLIDFDLKESVSKDADCVYRLAPVIKIKSVKSDT